MNRIKFKFSDLPTNSEGYYPYQIYINNSNTIIYSGTAFKPRNKTELVFDVTSILCNYLYKGLGILTPTWNYTENNYTQPTTTCTRLTPDSPEQFYTTVYVELNKGGVIIPRMKQVYFTSIPFEGERGERLINNKYYYFGNLVPKMPLTTKLRYGQVVYSSNSVNTTWGTKDLGNDSQSRVYNISIPNTDLYDGDTKILQVDTECKAPYYLCWITKNGGFQCQPFNSKKSTYSENYTTNYKLSYDEQKDIANRSIIGKWNLISGNLTAEEYKEFTDINRSPYLLLYITEYDKVVYVNPTDTTNEFKTEDSNNNKPLFYSINVESRENLLTIN